MIGPRFARHLLALDTLYASRNLFFAALEVKEESRRFPPHLTPHSAAAYIV
jgi:hypothetical protein